VKPSHLESPIVCSEQSREAHLILRQITRYIISGSGRLANSHRNRTENFIS